MLTDTIRRDPGHVFAGETAWREAVEAGAHGYGASALGRLDAVVRLANRVGDDRLASLATSTGASLYRQAGRHRAALVRDGRAAALADPRPEPTDPWAVAALADALVNLAADNLGLGRFGASARLLRRAGQELEEGEHAEGEHAEGCAGSTDAWVTGRCRVRLFWVRAELALYTGDPTAALAHARAARALVERSAREGTAGRVRHRVKTELIIAAATAAAGDRTTALEQAQRLRGQAREHGFVPLEWAVLSLLSGLADGTAATRADLDDRHRWLCAHGMPFVARAKAR